MCRTLIYSISIIMLLSIASGVQALEPFSIPPAQDVSVCNDPQYPPDSGAERGSGMHVRDIPDRRRVGIIVYDISELGGLPVQDVTFSNYGHDTGTIAVYGIIEELDDGIDEATIVWNTAPGVKNDPAPPLNDPVALDFADLTENILMIFEAPSRGVRASTEPNELLDDFINSDTDGIVAFLWAPYEEGDNAIVRTKEMGEEGGSYLEGLSIPPPEALKPNPADGQTDVIRDVVLSWRPGMYAETHNVYFGTDFNDVNEASLADTRDVLASQNQEELTYVPPEVLKLEQTYYWRVDEVNDAEPNSPWKGNVWSFTVANYIVVEDFEDYNDFEPDTVWNTWADGYDDPTNGSSAGYPDPYFWNDEHYLEDEIVHSGDWSMPLCYDNSSAMLSWVTRTLNADWTQEGVVTLTLFYHGDAANAAEPMYVALDGNAVVTNDDANAALVTEWTQWDIPLQSFADQGVNLANDNTMSIGFGNKANPVLGGSGHVFFDDIRLYLPEPQ